MLARGSRKAARELQKWCVCPILRAMKGIFLLRYAKCDNSGGFCINY